MLKGLNGLYGFQIRHAKFDNAEGDGGGGGGGAPTALIDDKGVIVDNYAERIPKEFKNRDKVNLLLSKFKGKPMLDVLSSHAELEGKMGSAVFIPGEGASEEEVAKFQTKLGRPDKPDSYKITVPEGVKIDETRFSAFKAAAHKKGWSNATLQTAVDMYAGELLATAQAQAAATQKAQEERATKLSTSRRLLESQWGTGEHFDRQAQFAQRAAEEAISKDFSEALIEAGLNDDPRVLAGLHKLGKKLGVKPIVFGKQGAEPSADQRLKTRYNKSPELLNG